MYKVLCLPLCGGRKISSATAEDKAGQLCISL